MTITTEIVVEEPPETQAVQEEIQAAPNAAGICCAVFPVASLVAGEVRVTDDEGYRPGCRCALEVLRHC